MNVLTDRRGGFAPVSMLEKWQCSQHRMRTVRQRIYAAHITVYRGIIEQLEQVEIDAFPTAFVTSIHSAYFYLLDVDNLRSP